MTIREESLELQSADGRRLAAHKFSSQKPAVTSAAIVIAGATGVKQKFYRPFARFLAEHSGLSVLTFDYRNVGGSLHSDLRVAGGRMSDLGEFDLNSALCEFSSAAGVDSIYVVGHSIGAQIIGLAAEGHRVSRALCIGGGHGYYRHYGHRSEANLRFWAETVPRSILEHGYLNGRELGLGDLSPEMGRDLARWCLSPHYIVDDEGNALRPYYADVKARMLFIVPDDDTVSPASSVEKMAEIYCCAQGAIEIVASKDVPGERIGHMGFFREDLCGSLWPRYGSWLID